MKANQFFVTLLAIAAVTLTTPLTAQARSHHTTGAVIAGLAVGLGVGIAAAAATEPAPVVYTQPAPVVYTQPAPVVVTPTPVIHSHIYTPIAPHRTSHGFRAIHHHNPPPRVKHNPHGHPKKPHFKGPPPARRGQGFRKH